MKPFDSTIILYILFLFLFILFIIILSFLIRRYYSIRKIRRMKLPEKIETLNAYLYPFGYRYVPKQDFISSHNNAWQRQAGYHELFDRSALLFSMHLDALPIYFNYRGRTWLIEFWKGQYGINTGAEVGIYHSDRLLSKEEWKDAHFQAVSDAERLPVAFLLKQDKKVIARLSETTWWLTAFLVGRYSNPSSLTLHPVIAFPNSEMQQCFLIGLRDAGLSPNFYHTKGNRVHILFTDNSLVSSLYSQNISLLKRLRIRYVNLLNRINCKLYMFLTKPFQLTLDKILYLATLLPFTIRHTLRHLRGTRRK